MQSEGGTLRTALAFFTNSQARRRIFQVAAAAATEAAAFVFRPRLRMAYTAILNRIRLLIPAELDGHYKSIRRAFEAGDLTAPSLSISEMQLARAISEFTSFPPNEASIETLEKRLNPKY
jgi:hypothetical protein